MGVLRLLVRLVVVGLLAGAVVLSVLRVLQPDAAIAVRLVALTPLALVAYAAVALLVLVPALRRRGAALVVLVVALAGIALHAWWLAPLWTGPQPPPAAGAEPFVVMSANVEGIGAADALAVVETASERGVDVLGLLEVTPEALASMDEGGLSALFPYRVGGEDDGIGGTVLLSRTPLGPATRVDTSDGSLVADLTIADRTVRTLVAHPVQPLSDVDQWRRDHAAVLAAAGDVDLLIGDLNATLDHEPLQALADAGLHDATERANAGWQPTWPTDGGSDGLPFPVVQIDHVLVGRRIAALDTDTVRLEGTDHAAILAEVAFT